jgi:predicted AAA+ superfamily ATPase
LEIAGQYHGKIINASNIAKPIGTTPNTVLEYFRSLEDTLIAFTIPGWHESTVKQLRRAPKFFLFDNGVANALHGELRIELSERTSCFDDLFEAFVIQEIFRRNEYEQLNLKLSYWQTAAGQEVDILLSRGLGAPIAAIEIKSATAPDTADLKGMTLFSKECRDCKIYCFCRTPHAYRIEELDVEVLPWQEGIRLLSSI